MKISDQIRKAYGGRRMDDTLQDEFNAVLERHSKGVLRRLKDAEKAVDNMLTDLNKLDGGKATDKAEGQLVDMMNKLDDWMTVLKKEKLELG